MYHVRIISGENVVVEHHMLQEPPSLRTERELIDDREDHWMDVQRIPFNCNTDYTLETNEYECD